MPKDDPTKVDDVDQVVEPAGVVAEPTLDLPDGYVYGVTRYADVLLSDVLPDRFNDLCDALSGFEIKLDELRAGGGGRTPFVKRFDDSLGQRKDQDGAELWGKRNITIEHRIGFDGDTVPLTRVRGHEIDMFGEANAEQPFPGVAVEMEWNNKDPFYDRDLINFQALHREGAIVAGVIVTRGPGLQRCLGQLLDKFGVSSTHWSKLIPRVELGGGGECPLLLIGIEPERVDRSDVIWQKMALIEEANSIRKHWKAHGFATRGEAKVRADELRVKARLGRL